MLGSFYAPKLKIERAQKHLAELETEVTAFLDSRPARFETNIIDEPGQRRFEFRLHFRQPGPLMGAIIGDVVHNLRTALDLVACDLVRWREGDDAADVRNVYFPVCAVPNDLETTISRRQFNRAGAEAVDVVRSIKPYRGGHPFLRPIHDLDIQDKHTALIVTPSSVASPVIRRWDDDGTINPVIIGDPTAPTELQIVFPADCPFPNRPVIETLRQCVDAINTIIEQFRGLTA